MFCLLMNRTYLEREEVGSLHFDKLTVKVCDIQKYDTHLHHPFIKGSDQRKNRWVWSNVNTRYLVWRCGDGGSFAL